MVAIDGNEATAYIAHRLSEVVAIYPITPSTSMAEACDDWASQGVQNIWGQVPNVVEMQSEGGAAGAVHGSLMAGAMTTTFTASQGLLLMIPNMYKIAGELTSTVFHISARSIAAQGLSIFGDHGDIMAARQTGWALLGATGVQEAQDMALVAHAASLEARIPFMHFFDGFRTSHEVMKIEQLTNDDIRSFIKQEMVDAHRNRGLSPDRPELRGTAQNPDVYFQGRESANKYYVAVPGIVESYLQKFKEMTGREYHLVEYSGATDAERVIVCMGSGSQTIAETVRYLVSQGEKVGLLNIRLYRPFPTDYFLKALPATVKSIAVLDRSKEPGATGEPLYLDVVQTVSTAFMKGELKSLPNIVGGRFGLSSKEFTPAMVKGVFDQIAKPNPKNSFTVGIIDDVTHTSIDYDPKFSIMSENVFQGLFFGLGADGTVGANKNSIKIIATSTDNYAQGYFVYDSKKSGSMTTSHLRFGKEPIRAPYLIDRADFVACHHTPFLDQIDMLAKLKTGGTFLLNTVYNKDEVWDTLPKLVQEHIVNKNVQFYVIDGYAVGKETGMGRRINTIMQTCFFAISGILPKDEAIAAIKTAIKKTYSAKGEKLIQLNNNAVDQAVANLHKVDFPAQVSSEKGFRAAISGLAPEFVEKITAEIIRGKGDYLPVSAMPADGTWPTGTAKFEKRDLSLEIPVWEEDLCIQCAKCANVCPHAVIRAKVYDKSELISAPQGFKAIDAKGFKLEGEPMYTIQVSPMDCTGCTVCVDVCPAFDKENPERKAINMAAQIPIAASESANWDFFVNLPEVDRTKVNAKLVKGANILEPLFEFSGACPGCGETPYVRLVTQLFGDRMLVANATGCSSIYGGNLPTTPWSKNKAGQGPAWANSLFEDNAEFGLGFRLAVDSHAHKANQYLVKVKSQIAPELFEKLTTTDQSGEEGIVAQRKSIAELKAALADSTDPDVKRLLGVADYLLKKSIWIIGGDGWAYDIGYGGLDHVLASGANVNILILDTEVYSNTGGQSSKSSPKGSVAKFAAAGKPGAKKDIGLIAMSYKNVYVGRVAMGANDNHTIKTLLEAEAYEGPSLVIAYSPCIAHGYELSNMLKHQKMAVDSAYWPLMRYNPELSEQGQNPLVLDSRAPKIPVVEYIMTENRFAQLFKSDKERAERLATALQKEVNENWKFYEEMAKPL
jgi:pyruvate-ferredoxin/flavodoxin oxidoreductase